jgi:hypothetical protein
MIKKLVFKILEEVESLISEEFVDNNNLVVKKRVFEGNSVHETLTVYNSNKKIISETDLDDGVELNRLEFDYDQQSRNTEERLFMSGELYQTKTAVYDESGYTKTTFIEEEETEKEVKVFEGKNYKIHYYENGELDQYQVCDFDESGLNTVLKAYDDHDNLIGEDFETFDASGHLVASKELDGNGNLIREVLYELEGDLYVAETAKDFSNGNINTAINKQITYDANGNQTKIEVKTPDDKLLGFQMFEYDEKNRVVLEKGLSLGSFNAIYGTSVNDNSFHFVFKYEEVD